MNIKSWDCVSDEFIFKFESLLKLAEGLEPIRRNLLKITSSFFDPFGVLSPVVVQMKVLFQMLIAERSLTGMHHSRGSPERVDEVASGPARGAASISAAVCLCWLGGRDCLLYYSWFRGRLREGLVVQWCT